MTTLTRSRRVISGRELPISGRHFLLALLATLAVAASTRILWDGNHLAGQQRRDLSSDPEPGVLVQGKVVDHETGDPVRGAAVSLAMGPSGTPGVGTRVSGDEGQFLFRSVPPGSYRIRVTVQGYERMSDTLQVPAEGALELILPLSIDPIRLDPIIVTAERLPVGMRGYARRHRNGSGILITREEIEERRPRFVSELLHRVPGGMVVSTPPHGYTLLLRGLCRPGIWIDGVELALVDSIDQLLSPHDVEAIEIYHGFELPVEFGVNSCGGVLIWTKMGTPSETGTDAGSRGDFFGRLVMAAGIILLTLLAIR